MRARAATLMSLMAAAVLAGLCWVAPLDAQSAPQVFGPKRAPVHTQASRVWPKGPTTGW